MDASRILAAGLIVILSGPWMGCGSRQGSEKAQDARESSAPASGGSSAEGNRAAGTGAQGWTEQFEVSAKHLVTEGKNPFFILEPGYQLVLNGEDEGASFELTITVLNETKNIAGFSTRVVEERETRGGGLVEVSKNYFSIDRNTHAVYYFGEDVDIYKQGKVASHEGSWLTGQNGAKFGLILPGAPKIGDKFYQEMAPGTAMDRAEIVSLNETMQTPAGTFTNCLKTLETSALNPDEQAYKFYAPGVGLIKEEELLLAKYGPAQHP